MACRLSMQTQREALWAFCFAFSHMRSRPARGGRVDKRQALGLIARLCMRRYCGLTPVAKCALDLAQSNLFAVSLAQLHTHLTIYIFQSDY